MSADDGQQSIGAFRLEAFLPGRIDHLAESVGAPLARMIAGRHGLNAAETRLLLVLGEHGTLNATKLGRLARMHKTSVSRTLSALRAKGLIARAIDVIDLRQAFVSLTPAGRHVHEKIACLARLYTDALAASVSAEEIARFEAFAQRLAARAEALASERLSAETGVRGSARGRSRARGASTPARDRAR